MKAPRGPEPVLDHSLLVMARRVVPVDRAARVELVEHEDRRRARAARRRRSRRGDQLRRACRKRSLPHATIAQEPASTAAITISSSRSSGATSAAATANAASPARARVRGCARRGRGRAPTRSTRPAPRRSARCRRTLGSRPSPSATRSAAGRETTNRARPYAGKNARLIASTPISLTASYALSVSSIHQAGCGQVRVEAELASPAARRGAPARPCRPTERASCVNSSSSVKIHGVHCRDACHA